jgi:hypothetical protein
MASLKSLLLNTGGATNIGLTLNRREWGDRPMITKKQDGVAGAYGQRQQASPLCSQHSTALFASDIISRGIVRNAF